MMVLVTGGAGFIGSHLVDALVAQGNRVRVLDNLSAGRRANLPQTDRVELVVGDVTDFDTVCQVVAGCEVVFHQAAMVSVPRSLEEPQLNHQTNVTGTFHVFEAARRVGVKRVVYASSSAVYGDGPELPKRETDPPAPMTPYAVAKLMNEQYAAVYQSAYGLASVGLRYMNVFGPRQSPGSSYSGVLSLFCQAAVRGTPCTVYGDGEQTRDFVYISDVVRANLLAAALPLPEGVAPLFNVGSGRQTSLGQIIVWLGELRRAPLTVIHQPPRMGDIRHSLADTTYAQAHLGFSAQVGVMAGLRRTLDWLEAHSAH